MTSPCDYMGWSNRATWNAYLWITNHEPYYREAVAKIYAGDSVERLAQILARQCHRWWGGMTKDNCPLDDVDWKELATALKEETV